MPKMLSSSKERYVNFFTDFGFKRLFGSNPSKALLIDFLNEMFKTSPRMPEGISPHVPIISLTYLKNEYVGRSAEDRRAVFDLHCKNELGEKFIIEMQKTEQQYFKDRALFYSSFPIVEQAKKGKWNYKLSPVYVIGILNFSFDNEKPNKYRHDVRLCDIEDGDIFHDKLAFTYFEMPKFKKKLKDLNTRFDKWLYAIKHLNMLDKIPPDLKEEIFEEFFKLAEISKMSRKDYEIYEDSLKVFRDLDNSIDTAAMKAHDEGLTEGLEKGEAIGIEKGEAIGFEKGETIGIEKGEAIGIRKAKFELAKNLIGILDVNTIAQKTGLSVEDIRSLSE